MLADLVAARAVLARDADRARGARRGAHGADVSVVVQLAWEIGGAVAFGALVGALFALYLRYVGREVTLVLLGCLRRSSARWAYTQEFEPLLAAMTAGLVIQNVAVPQGDALKAAIQRGALPVLVVFFVVDRRLAAARRADRDRVRRDRARRWSGLR